VRGVHDRRMTIEYPDQGYYPTWKVRLTIRLEEFDQGVLKDKVPPKLTTKLNGTSDPASGLEAVPDTEVSGRFVIQKKGGGTKNPPVLVPETSSDGLTHVIAGVIPKTFEWKANGFRTADEFKCSIRFQDMPLDPRVIRSVAVEFYLGTITGTEYAMGVQGLTRGDVFGGGAANASEPMNVVSDSYLDGNGNRRSNLRFQGWVDKWKLAMGEDEPLIEFECRDNTQLLLNQLISPRLVISGKDPLDKAIATYLANFPQFQGLTVEYIGPAGTTAPVMDKVLAKTAFRPDLGPQPSKGGDDTVVWDYLTDVAGSVGLSIFLDGTRVVIARPLTLLDGTASSRPDDPYRARKLPSGNFPVRAMIYGQNVLSAEISRDFANGETKNVEVRCWSPRRKQVLAARYPDKNARIPTSTPGDKSAENKWTIVRVAGIEDEKLLQQIAQDYYHGRNRNEIECVVKTRNFSSFGSGNADPDLLDLRASDPVEFLVDRSKDTTVSRTEKELTAAGANEKTLTSLGYSSAFASAYARAFTNAGFQRLFRVREMTIGGDVEEGVNFEIRMANFVQVRGEVKAP
jgi:hypothetical protein